MIHRIMIEFSAAAPLTVLDPNQVLRLADVSTLGTQQLLRRFGLEMVVVLDGAEIPGSYWGETEAGLVGNCLYARADTPVHSILHEACHFICMDAPRRAQLNRDAGGDFAEEDAVCYLQIVLAGFVQPMGRQRMFADMDAWGYTFRLGSAQRWFEADAVDAREWLINNKLMDSSGAPRWQVRF
jgi:hypothetical protein